MKFTDTLKELEAKAAASLSIDDMENFNSYLRNHAQDFINLVEAAEMAKLHVEELREGWRRGDIEADSGVRSNRNVYVETKLREALAALNKEPPKEIDPNKWAFDRKLESY